MDHPSQGLGDLLADPIPYVRGLYQLIPEGRLAAILRGYPGTDFRPKIRLWNEVRPTQHRVGTHRCVSPTRPT